jgi:hypothetical protein
MRVIHFTACFILGTNGSLGSNQAAGQKRHDSWKLEVILRHFIGATQMSSSSVVRIARALADTNYNYKNTNTFKFTFKP